MAEKNNKTKLVKRTGRVSLTTAYWPAMGQSFSTEFTCMEKFTTLSQESKNLTTYERQYVDKDSSDSDVTGYGTSWSYHSRYVTRTTRS